MSHCDGFFLHQLIFLIDGRNFSSVCFSNNSIKCSSEPHHVSLSFAFLSSIARPKLAFGCYWVNATLSVSVWSTKMIKTFFSQAHRSVDSARKALEKYSLLLLCGVDLKVERLKSCFCLSVNSIGKCDKFRYDWLKPRDDVTRPTNSKVKLIMNFEHENRKKREIFNWNQLRYANDVKTCHNTISAFVLRVNFFHTANNSKLSKKRKHQKCASLMKWINPVNYVTPAMP